MCGPRVVMTLSTGVSSLPSASAWDFKRQFYPGSHRSLFIYLFFYLTLWCSHPSRSSFSAYFSHVRLASGAARLPIRQSS